VGYDGSKSARKALVAALELALAFHGQAVALAVVRPPEFAELKGEIENALEEATGPLAEAFRWARKTAKKKRVPLRLHRQATRPRCPSASPKNTTPT
jgi:hypothetical protein